MTSQSTSLHQQDSVRYLVATIFIYEDEKSDISLGCYITGNTYYRDFAKTLPFLNDIF